MEIPMRKEERAFIYADYLSWPAEERWELIDGAAYDMSPDAWCRHQEIAVEILSPYTSIKDQREKLALYEHFEVKAYCIIDPANYMAALYSLRLTGGAEYGKPELFGLGDQLHSRLLDGFSLDLATLFAE